MTVEELAARMRLTPNAVRNQLAKLQESNLVARAGSRPGASKPSVVYAITLEGQIHFSTIYVPVLTQFLRTAEEECSEKELVDFMTATGKALAKRYPKPSGDIAARTKAAARLLKTLGGIPQVRSRNGTIVIESLGCPLSALTAENAAACRVLEGVVTEYVGVRARTCCVRDPSPRCCFEIDRDADRAHRT
jgi:predicted ArsR family transcriptional regulator